MPPKKTVTKVVDDSPLKKGELVEWDTKDGAHHEGKTLADEEGGEVLLVITKSRGKAPTWPFVVLYSADALSRL